MKIDKSLVAIVTGGASGLGLATVELLRAQGAQVVIADLNEDQGKEIATRLECKFFKTNVADEKNVQELFKFVQEHYKRVHVVVNCAGVIAAGTTIYSKGVVSSEVMEKVLKINVIGTLNMCKHAAKLMSESEPINGERGVLINVASVAGFEGQKGQVVYSASKGALIGMTLPMARDLGKYGIRVMTLAPGIFETPMGAGISKKYLEIMNANTPLGRLGNPSEFALACEGIIKNPYATGDTWRLDGGIRLPYM